MSHHPRGFAWLKSMLGLQMHLFDIDIPGKISFKESDTLTAGENIAVVDTEAGRLGLGICYDIRFPELAMIYARQGVQLILYPGAFLGAFACHLLQALLCRVLPCLFMYWQGLQPVAMEACTGW